MKTSKLFITSLLAAAAMSIPAFAVTPTITDEENKQLMFGSESGSVVNGMVAGSTDTINTSDYTLTFNTTGGYFGTHDVDANKSQTFNQNIVIRSLTTTNGYSDGTTTFTGSVRSYSNDVKGAINVDSTGPGKDFIFAGDMSQYAGTITINGSFTSGTSDFNSKDDCILQFGAATAAAATNTANISGTGAISTNAVLRYNYLAGDSALTVGNASISARYLEFKGGANYTVSSTVTGNNGTISTNTLKVSAGTTTFTGAVSKFGTINVASGAKAIFQGAFTNVVGTTKNNLTIAAGSDVSFQSTAEGGVLTANADSTVKFSSTASFTQLSGSGTIDLGSTGKLTLSNSTKFNNWTGTIKVGERSDVRGDNNNGVNSAYWNCAGATVEFSGAKGWLDGFNGETFAANIKLVDTASGAAGFQWKDGTSTPATNLIVTLSGKLTGTGTFERANATFNQSFVFSGNLSEFAGTFKHTDSYNYATLTFGGKTNAIEGISAADGSVTGTSTINWYQGTLDSGQDKRVYFNYSNDVRSDSTITGAILVKQGAGSLTLTGTNTYTGGTTVEAGTLIAGSARAFGSGALTVNAGAKVSANGYAVDLGAGNVTINGAYVVTADGSLATSGAITFGAAGTLDVSGLTAGTYTVFGGTGTVSGLTQDKLYKESGRDTVTFADDTYKTFTLTKGTVYDLTWTSAAGTWAADTTWQNNTQGGEENPTFADGDTVTFAASETAAKEISVVGAKDALAVNVTGGDYAFSAGEGGSLSVRGALTVSSGASLTLSDGVLGTVAGGIVLDGGTAMLKLVDAGLPGLTNIVSGSGKVVLERVSTQIAEPTISTTNVLTGAISVEKIGNTKVSITAAQSYTGGTTITAGNVGVGHNSALGSGTITLNGGQITAHIAALTLANAIEIGANGGTIHTNDNASNTITLNGTISGTGTLTKAGAGTLVLSNAGTSVDVAFAEGNLQVARATVNIVSTTSAGNIEFNSTGGTVVFKGTREPAGTSYSVGEIETTSSDNYARNVTIESGAMVNATSFTNSWGMGTLRVDGELNVSESLSFATGDNGNQTTNVITGDGTIKVGTLNIGNVGTYTIDVNRLEIGSGGITISNNRGTGHTTYLGKTTIVAAESWSSAVSSSQKFALNSSEGTTFELQKSDGTATNAAFASVFEGTGKLIKSGAGTLTLSGNNTFTGGVTIEQGVLVAGHANALGRAAGTTTVNSGGVLKVAVDGGVTAGMVTLNEGALLAIDLTEYSNVVEGRALTIIASSAISFNSQEFSSDLMENTFFDLANSNLGSWSSYLREWSYDTTNGLQLTLTIPEPSMFGLLAGLGALALAGTRRRRKKA